MNLEAEIWDIDTKGLRLMKYPVKTAGEAYSNLIKTFEMFIPELTLHIPKFIAEGITDLRLFMRYFSLWLKFLTPLYFSLVQPTSISCPSIRTTTIPLVISCRTHLHPHIKYIAVMYYMLFVSMV